MSSSKLSYIGLVNPKSPVNVASVLRGAGCFNASAVYYTGERYTRAREFYADTKDVHKQIPVEAVPDLQQVVPEGAKVVVIELVEGAIPLPEYQHPANAFYIFGPEDGSVPASLVARADDVVYVPTTGCMNLAATANVVLYDRLAKSQYQHGDELIRASRDRNNQLRTEKS